MKLAQLLSVPPSGNPLSSPSTTRPNLLAWSSIPKPALLGVLPGGGFPASLRTAEVWPAALVPAPLVALPPRARHFGLCSPTVWAPSGGGALPPPLSSCWHGCPPPLAVVSDHGHVPTPEPNITALSHCADTRDYTWTLLPEVLARPPGVPSVHRRPGEVERVWRQAFPVLCSLHQAM